MQSSLAISSKSKCQLQPYHSPFQLSVCFLLNILWCSNVDTFMMVIYDNVNTAKVYISHMKYLEQSFYIYDTCLFHVPNWWFPNRFCFAKKSFRFLWTPEISWREIRFYFCIHGTKMKERVLWVKTLWNIFCSYDVNFHFFRDVT